VFWISNLLKQTSVVSTPNRTIVGLWLWSSGLRGHVLSLKLILNL
jgi:hypothetical protein